MIYVMNTEELQIVALCDTEVQAYYLADLKIPKHDYLVDDLSVSSLSRFGEYELHCICLNHNLPVSANSSKLAMIGLLMGMKDLYDPRTVEQLHKALGRAPSTPSLQAVPKPAPAAPRATTAAPRASSTPGRPKPGTTTARVWDFCDEFYKRNGGKPSRADLVGGLPDVNPSTLSVQFSHWRSSNGL